MLKASNSCNPMVMIDAGLDVGQRASDVLDLPKMRNIYDRYPAAFKKIQVLRRLDGHNQCGR